MNKKINKKWTIILKLKKIIKETGSDKHKSAFDFKFCL